MNISYLIDSSASNTTIHESDDWTGWFTAPVLRAATRVASGAESYAEDSARFSRHAFYLASLTITSANQFHLSPVDFSRWFTAGRAEAWTEWLWESTSKATERPDWLDEAIGNIRQLLQLPLLPFHRCHHMEGELRAPFSVGVFRGLRVCITNN